MFIKNSFEKVNVLNNIIVIFLCIAFIVSDWTISLFTFSDFIFVLIVLLILGNQVPKISKKTFIAFGIIEFYFILHILLSHVFIDDFILKIALTNFVKLSFYLIFVMLVYHYLIMERQIYSLFKCLNIFALITIIIGSYISLIIIFDINLPYEFLWEFTRQDISSYTFEDNDFFVRTRSLFSEPAHLGYFLNVVLIVNMFSEKYKASIWMNTIIIFGIIITFSYSSIGVMIIILALKFLNILISNYKSVFNFKLLIVLLIFSAVLFLFKDILYTVLIDRTLNIVRLKDYSFMKRFIYSWEYINKDNLLLGNGLGHTPAVQNIYAYMISDLGVISLIISVILSAFLIKINVGFGISFIALNFQKGGYLSSIYWLILLLVFLFKYEKDNLEEKYGEI